MIRLAKVAFIASAIIPNQVMTNLGFRAKQPSMMVNSSPLMTLITTTALTGMSLKIGLNQLLHTTIKNEIILNNGVIIYDEPRIIN